MGNCLCKRKREPKRTLTLGLFGVDNAGKTTTVKVLAGEPHTDTTPTVGFNNADIGIHHYDIKFYDLGGGKKIRDIWQTYFPEIYGIVYVVDSTAADRMEEVKHNLKVLLENEKVQGKPVLLLANKQDQESALDEVDIMEQLSLENIVNINKCPCRIETCSAIKGTGKKMDASIKNGIKWLCGMIDHNWEKYHTRVERDMEEDRKRREAELEARRERVRKQREERERKEREENERLGIKPPQEEEEDIEEMDGGPFRRLDVQALEKKERKLKEEKRRKKEKQKKYDENNEEDEKGSDEEIPHSARRLNYSNSLLYANSINNNRNDDDDNEGFLPPVQKRDTPRLPPLQRPIGTKFTEESPVRKLKKKKKKPKLKALKENVEENSLDVVNQNYSSYRTTSSDVMDDQREGEINTWYKESVNSLSKIEVNAMSSLCRAQNGITNDGYSKESVDDEVELTTRKKKRKGSRKKPRSEDEVNGYGHDLTTPRTLAGEEETDDDVTPRREKLKRANAMEGDDKEIKTNRKKKSYLRNNKTYPSDDESFSGEDGRDRDFSWTMNPMGKPFSPRGAKMTTSHTNWDKKKFTPRDIDFSISSTRNWGLAEDLPEIDNTAVSSRRLRSNVEDDEDIVY
ncbi:ADP-ribosylation factor-like protein 13B [Saccostrea echinata]|uniref:ADP-ribosylation factor-like protein 13B n=1 Tax=Saccostrea echinata TaxID=191078 RepID=UPI002A819131|nr:ADP-ribosylation factor-like protein 13B [Saccostrea echinata]